MCEVFFFVFISIHTVYRYINRIENIFKSAYCVYGGGGGMGGLCKGRILS